MVLFSWENLFSVFQVSVDWTVTWQTNWDTFYWGIRVKYRIGWFKWTNSKCVKWLAQVFNNISFNLSFRKQEQRIQKPSIFLLCVSLCFLFPAWIRYMYVYWNIEIHLLFLQERDLLATEGSVNVNELKADIISLQKEKQTLDATLSALRFVIYTVTAWLNIGRHFKQHD